VAGLRTPFTLVVRSFPGNPYHDPTTGMQHNVEYAEVLDEFEVLKCEADLTDSQRAARGAAQ